MSLRELSCLIGKEDNFIRKQLHRKNISLPLLYLLTVHLQVNFFELILSLLPEHLSGTRKEAALQAEIEALKKQLAEMTKERDIYKEIAQGVVIIKGSPNLSAAQKWYRFLFSKRGKAILAQYGYH